jgi:hypothetical protein
MDHYFSHSQKTMTMKKLVLLLVATLTFTSISNAQTLENTVWHVSMPGFSAGKYVFQNGQLHIYFDGSTVPYMNYSVSGSTVTVNYLPPQECLSPGSYSYQISGNTLNFTLINDPCDGRDFFFVDMDWTVASLTNIASHEAIPDLEVYPVPSRDQLFITRADAGAMSVNIYNMIGELVHQEQLSGVRNELHLGALPAGNYVLQAVTTDGTASRRIVLE